MGILRFELLSLKNFFRCGPAYGHARCSVIESDWKIQKPANGPCCSAGHYCGTTDDHCLCADCVDFRTIVESKFIAIPLFSARFFENEFIQNLQFLAGVSKMVISYQAWYQKIVQLIKIWPKRWRVVRNMVRVKVSHMMFGEKFMNSELENNL